MAKTERILSYLPGTFRALPRPTALYSVVDAFGRELLGAENSLAAVMQAHWVDHADRGATVIDDLARMAALYGLAPRDDETVEAFREHLKRYIRTFLEGTVTVQGIFRITAEALGLNIVDDYAAMDCWWQRPDDALVTLVPDGADAAEMLLGRAPRQAAGTPAFPAQLSGATHGRDLSGGADLRQKPTLRLQFDGGPVVTVDLVAGAADPAAVTLDEIVSGVNAAAGHAATSHDGRYLTVAAPAPGPDSRLALPDGDGDAADLLLGLPPYAYQGAAAAAATITGHELADPVDLTASRYLRLLIDGQHLAEIDCAGPDPANTTLDQIRAAINDALGLAVASHDSARLTLTSPTIGAAGTIAFQRPAAQDAADLLFGPHLLIYTGRDARAATATGRANLSPGVDLSQAANLRLRLDGGGPLTINCAGADPANTELAEIIAAINAAVGQTVARRNGRFLELISPTTGPTSSLKIETPVSGDATGAILGFAPRVYAGSAATPAQIVGQPDLSAGRDLMGRYRLQLAVDGAPPLTVDLRAAAADRRAVSLSEMAQAVNEAAGSAVASHDGIHFILTSPMLGATSRLAAPPLTTTVRRRFTSRTPIIDEAAQLVFGFVSREASGEAAVAARIAGQRDLSRGVDLREARHIRLAVDDGQPVDIDCGGARRRATLLAEIVAAINDQTGSTVAAHNGRHLILTSPTVGAASRLALTTPRAEDALDRLLDLPPGLHRGQSATRVTFVGTTDLSGGVDLSGGGRIRLAIDGATPVEIDCAGADPAQTRLTEIMIAINVAVGANVASHDGRHVVLTSGQTGTASQLAFLAPSADDATAIIFGIEAPRDYHGAAARPARIVGRPDLSGGANLSTRRFLQLGIDGAAPLDIDCAAGAADPAAATLGEIIVAINSAAGAPIATGEDGHLVLQSPTAGLSGRLLLAERPSADARALLFGDAPAEATGVDPRPATITGDVTLRGPVNLGERRLIRLAVDDNPPTDILVTESLTGTASADDIIAAVNAVYPDLASLTDDDRLQLKSPNAGPAGSRLALEPLRYLEVVEYPPAPMTTPAREVRHGEALVLVNDGAAPAYATAIIGAPQGANGPGLVNETSGWQLRVNEALAPGETLRLWRTPEGGVAAIIEAEIGASRPVPGAHLLAGPAGVQAVVPTAEPWPLARATAADEPPALQLNEPFAPALVRLAARDAAAAYGSGRAVTVTVLPADLAAVPPVAGQWNGRLQQDGDGFYLADAEGALLARLRGLSDAALAIHLDQPVAVHGELVGGAPPVLQLTAVARLYDVTVRFAEPAGAEVGTSVQEAYHGVTLGHDAADSRDLTSQIQRRPSALVTAASLPKGEALAVPRGRSDWRYRDCFTARFNQAHFNRAYFAGGRCTDRGVFDLSRFTFSPPEAMTTVFASRSPEPEPPVAVSMAWDQHWPGAFAVNLPADLPEKYGAFFNSARFGETPGQPETYDGVVAEPLDDPDFLVTRLAGSRLVTAAVVNRVPLGWEPVELPFRQPRYLSLGDAASPARIYLAEEGLDGFIELSAREPGAWGNQIAVSGRASGPAMYDLTVSLAGGRFENGRHIVLGPELAALSDVLLAPGPVGVRQAKAAGVHTAVTRDRAGSPPHPTG